jgi:hypothetical protein
MKIRLVWVAAVTTALAISASAQTDVKALQSAIHGKPLGLRSYSADAEADYTWTDNHLSSRPVKLHGLEVFVDDSAYLSYGKIVVTGTHETLLRYGSKLALEARSPMVLKIDLKGADPATVIPQLQAALFFPDLQSAIDNLPRMVANMIPAAVDKSSEDGSSTKPTCDCDRIFKEGSWIDIEKSSARYRYPVLIGGDTTFPEFSQAVMDNKISGIITVAIHISDKGRVDEIWLLRPLGFGVDEVEADSVRTYRYKPAQLDGKPIESVISFDSAFKLTTGDVIEIR